FVLQGTQATQLEDLAKTGIPFHAGLWGLARSARREQHGHVGCIDVGLSGGAAAIWRRLQEASQEGEERELLVQPSFLGGEESDSDEVERHVARLEQTSAKARGVWPPPVFPSHSWYVISAGLVQTFWTRRFWWPGHRHRWVAGDAGRTAVSASG
ncbi:unnamed protein product, partial [Effrenium voratum]